MLYHPTLAPAFALVWQRYLVIPVGTIFGACNSPSFYMEAGETSAHLAMHVPRAGNAIRWKKQFKIADMDKYRGRIQRLLGPAKPKAKKVELVELKDPEGDNDGAGGETEADGNGNVDEEEAGEEGDKAQADAKDEVSESFFMFIWHCFIAQLPLF